MPKKVLGSGKYAAVRDGTMVTLGAVGLASCMNDGVELEITQEDPPKCTLWIIKQDVCLTAMKPFNVHAAFRSDARQVVVTSSSGDVSVPVEPSIRGATLTLT